MSHTLYNGIGCVKGSSVLPWYTIQWRFKHPNKIGTSYFVHWGS